LIRVEPASLKKRFFSKIIAVNKAAHGVRHENTNNFLKENEMKTARMLVILVLVLVGLAGVARSQTSTDVYGVDDPAVDVQAVQDAVDIYDIVYLHGTFDFGGSGVELTHSVEILGEGTDTDGEYLTKIEGGGLGALSSVSPDNADVEWAVRDIEFDGARRAILTTYSKRFEVTGCRISVSSDGWANGVCMNGPFGVWGTHVKGSVTIEDNYIDLSDAGGGGIGIMAQMIFADVEVVGNTVENCSTSGLWINSAGAIEIKDNTINAGPAKPTWYRNGILVGSWYLPSGDRGNIEVTDNMITTGGHERDNGIVAEDAEQEGRDVCRVEDNVITYVDNSPGGRGLLLINHSSFWTFKDNSIDGGGNNLLAGIALQVGGIQEHNVFSNNHVFNANFVVGGVFIDSSADAIDNEFVENKLEHIGGDGFIVDGNLNWLIGNKLKDVTGDGIILKGNNNTILNNKFVNIGGQHIVDEGVDNIIGEED
jgi:hypothetical protein